jgi:hypothetical protein
MMHHARTRTRSGRTGEPSLTLPPSHPGTLEELAERVRRLSPDRRDPERFHMEKDELAAELRRLARHWRAA